MKHYTNKIFTDSLKSEWINYAVFPSTYTDKQILDFAESQNWPLESYSDSHGYSSKFNLTRKGSRVLFSIFAGLNHV